MHEYVKNGLSKSDSMMGSMKPNVRSQTNQLKLDTPTCVGPSQLVDMDSESCWLKEIFLLPSVVPEGVDPPDVSATFA